MMTRVRTTAVVGLALLGTAACADEPEGASSEATTADVSCDDIDYGNPPDAPVPIRIGHGVAAEEPLWLMAVQPELTENQGSWYELEMKPFRATADRLVAYQAGELDAVVATPNALITGEARESLDLYSIATVMREAEAGAFSTTFVTREGSGITSTADLADATIGIVDVGSHIDVLARVGVRDGGHDPATDAEYVVFPFPGQEDALREGTIQVASLPEPFYSLAHQNGGIVDVYSAADVLDFGFDLLTLGFDRSFVEENTEAVCAWQKDYERTMDYWRNDNEEARTTLAATDYVPLPEEAYLNIGDYARPEGGAVDIEGLTQFMETMIEFGVLEEEDRIDPNVFVYRGVTAGT